MYISLIQYLTKALLMYIILRPGWISFLVSHRCSEASVFCVHYQNPLQSPNTIGEVVNDTPMMIIRSVDLVDAGSAWNPPCMQISETIQNYYIKYLLSQFVSSPLSGIPFFQRDGMVSKVQIWFKSSSSISVFSSLASHFSTLLVMLRTNLDRS